jgi:cation:H+ antiporter
LFEQFGLLGNTLILIASLVALDRAIDLTLTNVINIANITGYGKTTIGFLLVAFCTSLPALFVSVFSAIEEENLGIAIGNALGSTIMNICLILGACLILVALKSSNKVNLIQSIAKEEIGILYFGLFIGSFIPLTLIYIGNIGNASRLMGVALLAIFALYTYQLSKKRTRKEVPSSEERQKLGRYEFMTLIGIAVVVIISYLIVGTASFIAISVGIPPVIIGGTIVAFGTSVPVLMASIHAILKEHPDLILGNIVGTSFINTSCILGVALTISPLRVDMIGFSSLVVFSVIANLFLWYFLSNEKISWREGVVLLLIYVLFLIINFCGGT